jgi:hypothetical protein
MTIFDITMPYGPSWTPGIFLSTWLVKAASINVREHNKSIVQKKSKRMTVSKTTSISGPAESAPLIKPTETPYSTQRAVRFEASIRALPISYRLYTICHSSPWEAPSSTSWDFLFKISTSVLILMVSVLQKHIISVSTLPN